VTPTAASPLAAARTLVFDARFRFDTFVIGDATRDAVEAARAAAETPNARWNPLVVRGGAGQGKSHLLGAVASRARELRPTQRVVALSAADGAPPLGAPSVVLIDDVRPGLDGARAAELCTLVDAALAAGAQVVIAEERSGVSRDEATEWVSRYPRARLVRLGAPDEVVRLEIVRNAAANRSLALDADVLAAVARDAADSVRDLLGRLTRATTAPPTLSADVFSLGEDGDFASFLDEVAREVAAYAEPWRVRVGEAASRWRGDGHDVEMLERALREPTAPDVDALLAAFEAEIAQTREAARVAARRAEEERLAVERAEAARAVRRSTPAPSARPTVDAEGWVLEWPEVRDLLVEAYR